MTARGGKCQVLIFSKDRPAQLELLLRSWTVFHRDPASAEVVVIYRAEDRYAEDYARLAEIFNGIRFCDESTHGRFKTAVLASLSPDAGFLIFLVDDQVFLRPFVLGDLLREFTALGRDCATISLRMHPGISYAYCFGTVCPPRTLDPATLEWQWSREPANSEWGVVASLDGNLYRMQDVLPILRDQEYSNPCVLEEKFVDHHTFRLDSRAKCHARPVTVTVPLNQTQNTHSHKHSGLADLEAMNREYHSGARIALLPFLDIDGSTVHREQEPVWLPPKSPNTTQEAVVIPGDQSPEDFAKNLEMLAWDGGFSAIIKTSPPPTDTIRAIIRSYESIITVKMEDAPAGEEHVPSDASLSARKEQWAGQVRQSEQNLIASTTRQLSSETSGAQVRQRRMERNPAARLVERIRAGIKRRLPGA